jgi:hypothetical protein
MNSKRRAAWAALAVWLVVCGGALALEGLEPLGDADFAFALGGMVFHLGEPAAPLLALAQEITGPLEVLEAESCLFPERMDREYSNETLLVATFPTGLNGADTIETIMALAGDWTTARGIGIGTARADILAAYGTPWMIDSNLLIYALGDPLTEPLLVFELDSGGETGIVVSFYFFKNTVG